MPKGKDWNDKQTAAKSSTHRAEQVVGYDGAHSSRADDFIFEFYVSIEKLGSEKGASKGRSKNASHQKSPAPRSEQQIFSIGGRRTEPC
jgi:hypothetical protein